MGKVREAFVEKIMTDLLEYKKTVSDMQLREQLAREEAEMLQHERDTFAHNLKEAMNSIHLLNTKLCELTHNYAALAHVIETKNKMVKEVKQVKNDLQSAREVHQEEVATLRAETEAVRQEGKEDLHRALKQEKACGSEAAEKAASTLRKKEAELEDARKELQEVQDSHFKTIENIRDQNHKEQEQLKGRLAQLKQNLSSMSLSNLDLFTSKLQATRGEYEDQLRERGSKVRELEAELGTVKEELRQAKETLKHQKYLSVVRGMTTAPPASPMASTAPSPATHSPSIEEEIEARVVAVVIENSEEDTMKRRKWNTHNRTMPVTTSLSLPCQSSCARVSNKRKLCTANMSLLLEDQE